jgi:pantothenate kinase
MLSGVTECRWWVMSGVGEAVLSVAEAVQRAEALAAPRRRVLIGIAGAPGAGKSTLAHAIAQRLGPAACVVGMDGFHLAQHELERLGRAERKGAPDTFDAAGYVAMLRRLRDPAEDVVYAPEFSRAIEEPIAGAVAVDADVPVIVTEGNYLLLDDGPWREVRPLLDEAWFVLTAEETRLQRLISRHVEFGRAYGAARAWALGTDQRNAELVSCTRQRADVTVLVDG